MPSASAAAAAGYRPRPAHNALKDIVEENLETLLRVHPQLRSRVDDDPKAAWVDPQGRGR